MRRIKHSRLSFYSVKAGEPHYQLPTVVESNDLVMLLRVARAADGLKYDSGVRVKWPDWLLPLEAALDALNARKGKP